MKTPVIPPAGVFICVVGGWGSNVHGDYDRHKKAIIDRIFIFIRILYEEVVTYWLEHVFVIQLN